MSQVQICIDDCVVQFSVITKELSSNSICLKYLLIGIMVMWFWYEHKISFNLAEEWIEDLWNRIIMNLWLWACLEILCSSRSLCVLCVLRSFFLFEGWWWKLFGVLEAWIHRASLICGLWGFWRLLSLIPMNFEIWAGSLDDSSSNVFRIWRFVVEVLWGFGGLNL